MQEFIDPVTMYQRIKKSLGTLETEREIRLLTSAQITRDDERAMYEQQVEGVSRDVLLIASARALTRERLRALVAKRSGRYSVIRPIVGVLFALLMVGLWGCGGSGSSATTNAQTVCRVTSWVVWDPAESNIPPYVVPAPPAFIALPQVASCGEPNVGAVYDQATGENLCTSGTSGSCTVGAACVATIETLDPRGDGGTSLYPYAGTCVESESSGEVQGDGGVTVCVVPEADGGTIRATCSTAGITTPTGESLCGGCATGTPCVVSGPGSDVTPGLMGTCE